MELTEVGKILGISGSTVRQIEQQALKRLPIIRRGVQP
jgi:DNA-directed RNA polymerase specialized sigma subunit